MDTMNEKDMARAQARADAKAARDDEMAKVIFDNLVNRAAIHDEHEYARFCETDAERLEYQRQMEEGQCNNCASNIKKTTFYANMVFCGFNIVASCFLIVAFMFLLHLLTCIGSMGALAADVDALHAAHTTDIVARGLDIDLSSTFVPGSVCTLSTRTTYPTPSKGFVTKNVGGVSVTDHIMVTPTAAHNVNASCTVPEPVTVTVTTTSANDAVSATAGDGGAPPASSDTTTATGSGSVTSFTTVTTTSTSTATSTLTDSETSTSHSVVTSTSADGRTTFTVTDSETSTAHVTITINTTTVTVTPALTTGTAILNTGTGTGTFTLHPSANGTYTYSVPSVAPTSSGIVTSDGGASTLAGRGSGPRGGDVTKRGNSSGFYCVVMAVACALAVVVV